MYKEMVVRPAIEDGPKMRWTREMFNPTTSHAIQIHERLSENMLMMFIRVEFEITHG